jgi:hypothetical protein
MRTLAQLPNVYVKVGGLGMRINGFDFEKGAKPPSSAQLACVTSLSTSPGSATRASSRQSAPGSAGVASADTAMATNRAGIAFTGRTYSLFPGRKKRGFPAVKKSVHAA